MPPFVKVYLVYCSWWFGLVGFGFGFGFFNFFFFFFYFSFFFLYLPFLSFPFLSFPSSFPPFLPFLFLRQKSKAVRIQGGQETQSHSTPQPPSTEHLPALCIALPQEQKLKDNILWNLSGWENRKRKGWWSLALGEPKEKHQA